METQETKSTYRLEREARDRKDNELTERLLVIVRPTLGSLGLVAEVIERETDSSDVRSKTIKITKPGSLVFEANLGAAYKPDKGYLTCDTYYRVKRSYKNYNGIELWSHDSYDFRHYLGTDKAKELGLYNSTGYQAEFAPLSMEFSANKNIKLIINQVAKALRLYIRLVEAVEASIVARVARDQDFLRLANKLRGLEGRASDCGEIGEIRTYHFNIGGNSIELDHSGNMTITQSITERDLDVLVRDN